MLHLYRYSPETRGELIEIIDKISSNLWLPEQAAYEYLKNRPKVISEQITNLEAARKEVCDSKSKLTDQLKNKNTRSHPYYSDAAKKKYEDGARALLDELDSSLEEIKNLFSDDPTKEKIADWFENRTGEAFSQTDFDKHCQEGEKRYSEKTPPGYADAEAKSKKDTVSEKRSRYGDWLIWRQLMDYAKSEKMDVIFVTDDAKEDWWLQKGDGEIFTPRPELVEEFHKNTEQHVLIYSFLKFLKHGRNHLQFKVSSEAEDETKTINLDLIARSAASRLAATSLTKLNRSEILRSDSKGGDVSTLEGQGVLSLLKDRDKVAVIKKHLNETREEIRKFDNLLRDARYRYDSLFGDSPETRQNISVEEWVLEKEKAVSDIENASKMISRWRNREAGLIDLLDGLIDT